MYHECSILMGLHALGQVHDLPDDRRVIDERPFSIPRAVWLDGQQVSVPRIVVDVVGEPATDQIVRIMFCAAVLFRQEKAGFIGEVGHLSRVAATLTAHLALKSGLSRYDEMTFCQYSSQFAVLHFDAQTCKNFRPLLRGALVELLQFSPEMCIPIEIGTVLRPFLLLAGRSKIVSVVFCHFFHDRGAPIEGALCGP